MDLRIVLTGATGFLGSHLLENFILKGYNVAIIKRTTSNVQRISHLLYGIESFDCDLVSLSEIFSDFQPDIVVHTACNYGRSGERPIDIVKSNLVFGLSLFQESINSSVKILVNTDTVLPKYINNYSLSKYQFRDWLKMSCSDLHVINMRLEYMYGTDHDNTKFLPWLVNEMKNSSKEILLTEGRQRRDFTYVSDIVKAFDVVIENRFSFKNFTEFDVGTGVYTEVRDFVLEVAQRIERKYALSIISRLVFGAIDYRQGELMAPLMDIASLRELGWYSEIDIHNGISKII